jgi:hypothetical protein
MLLSGIEGRIFRRIDSVYVRWGGEVSEILVQTVGVRQGYMCPFDVPFVIVYYRLTSLLERGWRAGSAVE